MKKLNVFITGASGNMGFESLKRIMKHTDIINPTILVRDTEYDKKVLTPYLNDKSLKIVWGDLLEKEKVRECLIDCDLVIHIAALVSPKADYYPAEAMKNNLGMAKLLVDTIVELGQKSKTRFVNIGTVAETGDRMPPIHWGRVGDPIKPSMFDYYAVSKIAAERYVIESDLDYWVSLRQTGIIGPQMSKVRDAIMFHNCLDNVLEYVSDRDSGIAISNLAVYLANKTLSEDFWCHIYNIGGGEGCRVSTYELFKELYGRIGITKLHYVLEPKFTATRNFHGQYYLDSDKLEEYLHFRHDTMDYYYDSFIKELGPAATASKVITKLPGGQKLMGFVMKKMFSKLQLTEHGTKHFINDNIEDHIDAYWGSKKAWEALPTDLRDYKPYTEWDKVILLDHGYDESKPESELDYNEMKKAVEFRGGELLSNEMKTGDLRTKLKYKCAFGHVFVASPRLVLEGGHWCPICEAKSWNYGNRAKVDKFFAQVWNPLHDGDETREYPKIVSEDIVE